ncbi:hypothetical protein [Clostridium sp. DFI.1.208]|uniref:hypothetical protein n=1 Tax=Clostridium sp. DFI.1.208 TaxID=2965527 RepID=UPI0015B99F52|nr:hypothetical protein [Clostridium sp. DFI.1.208]
MYKQIIRLENKKYFPIIISNTRGTLNQALLYSLQKSLNNEGIDNLTVDNDFIQVINRIEEWKKNYPDTYVSFENELKANKISIEKFANAIRTYNESAYNMFKRIHKNILSGAEFVSQNSLEVVDYYRKIANQLINNYEYDGVYIVFDEFSKFLESRDEKTISNDMKIIQDLSELCNNSKTENIYLQLIMHKPINDYLSVDKRIRNAFKGIEGRVNAYYFVSSLKNSFDLVSNVITKTKNYSQEKKKLKDYSEEVYKKMSQLPPFYSNFTQEYLEKEMFDACFPLHPLTVYLLIKINEKVAQNERTLFTFLSKDTQNSLPFIMNRDIDAHILYPDVIFDYFLNQFLEEKDNVNIQKIATNCISAISNTSKPIEALIIKTLSLLLIINEKDILPSNGSVLASSLMIDSFECESVINNLENKGILIKRLGGQIQFKINMDLNLNGSIDNLINTKLSRVNVPLELSKIEDSRFIYPRTYNIINSITRYFRVEYINEDDFFSLDSVNYYFSDNYADGLIMYILRGEDDRSKQIYKKVKEINEDLLVSIYPTEYNDYSSVVKRYMAIKLLISDNEFIDNNILVKKELELLMDDVKEELDELVNMDYSLSSTTNKLFCSYNKFELDENKRMISKNRILGDIFSHVYCEYPAKFNLELINKENVKGSYRNAREKVVDSILNNKLTFDNLGTSPEDTITNCILIESGIYNGTETTQVKAILEKIFNYLSGETDNFGVIYSELIKPPYGIRKGIMPILLAWQINKLGQCILINYKQQEVELNAQLIESINEDPNNYNFTIDEISASKISYLDSLAKLFECEIGTDVGKSYSGITNSVKNWYVSLPKFTKQMIGIDEIISSKKHKLLKKQLSQTNINASEFILFTLPKVFNTNEFDKLVDQFAKLKSVLDKYCQDYLLVLKASINSYLGFDDKTTLTQSLNYWLSKNNKVLSKTVLEPYEKEFINVCNTSQNDNELTLINKVAYCFTSLFIEDWSNDTYDLFEQQLQKISHLTDANNENDGQNSISITVDGETIVKRFNNEDNDAFELIENFIDGTIEDYGDLLNNEQKIALLVRIMKKYL